ncbi:MAG: helix-turn-helix transcriptional regulator [Chitinophagaceae bacterium]|nr:helix-turn-helix transcriptional regulator [Anaerolineae bacterium]
MAGKLRSRFLILLTEKELREGRRIRYIEIAADTGVSQPAVGRWAKNEVTKFEAPVLEAFCKYFQCEIGELLVMDWEAEGE